MSKPKGPEHTVADDVSHTVDRIGRTMWGVGSRLFGSKVIPPPSGEPDAISPDAAVAIEAAGATVGRWLHAAGKAIEAHPFDPGAAVQQAQEHINDIPEAEEGETVLTAGVREFGGGLYKVAEGVLDVVAPRKRPESEPKP
jgi:hypothetical protein